MTQASSAQTLTSQLAWQPARKGLTLAQRRATFEAQMRDMALSDLQQVSARLKGLHAELEQQEGRKITHYTLAEKMKIPPRTFQSWENGEVENSNGKGYDKMARFYSRKLGRKITRNWILFGCEEAPQAETPDLLAVAGGNNGQGQLDRIEKTLEKISETLEVLAGVVGPLLEKSEAARLRQLGDSEQPRSQEHPEDRTGSED